MSLDNGHEREPEIAEAQEALNRVAAEYMGTRSLSSNGHSGHVGGSSPPLQDHEILTLAYHAQNAAKFGALWQGDTSGYASASEADLALASILAFYTQDRSQLERLFTQSGLGRRDKWQKRDDYRGDTISKALSGMAEVYKGPRAGDHTNGNGYGARLNGEPTKAAAVVATLEHEAPATDDDGVIIPPVLGEIQVEPQDNGEPLTDLGNAERLVRYFGEYLRFCPALGWLCWDGRRFVQDEGLVLHLAKRTARAIYDEAGSCPDLTRRQALGKHAIRTEAIGRIAAMVKLAESDPRVRADVDDLDADPWLLNVRNGTLDLRMGRLRAHIPADLITKLAPVDWDGDAAAPVWQRFLADVFDGKEELTGFVQRAVGYGLTGLWSEQLLFIFYGRGANGKSTFLDTVSAMLGDYARQASTETFMAKRGEGSIPNDVARLQGARFVQAQEIREGRRLDEALVKQVTGGDRITARYLHKEWFEFTPAFKLFLSVNHKPEIRGSDNAIWRRIRLVPFTVTFPREKQDTHLREKLAGELSGILRWAVEGCLEWRRGGLQAPPEVEVATAAYRTEMDVIAGFLEERCEVLPQLDSLSELDILAAGWHATAKDLYDAFLKYREEDHERPLSKKAFGQRMGEKGLLSKPLSRNVKAWWGVKVVSEEGG